MEISFSPMICESAENGKSPQRVTQTQLINFLSSLQYFYVSRCQNVVLQKLSSRGWQQSWWTFAEL